MNVLDTLEERGFIDQTTHDKELRDHLAAGPATCYIGFDPTASSLHIGSLVCIMALAHMQRHGHRPIALVGGGTGLVGDPSGKTEMRQILTTQVVAANALALKNQLSRFIDFSADKAFMVNNIEWLGQLGYIDFLRDYGRYFSVNRMLKAESYKMRLDSEEGLSFIEFNYMLLQAYDYLRLHTDYDCGLQMGGSDQWGNIVAGIELIRRMRRQTAFGITFPLITTSTGAKMGKTAQGAVWLDAERTAPYDYYQYWVNTDDKDVVRFLGLYTFLPMEEIRGVDSLADADLNGAKSVLAFETTCLVHGRQEALKAFEAATSMFGGRPLPDHVLPASTIPREISDAADSAVPSSRMARSRLEEGIPAFKLFQTVGLAATGGAGRRLIEQGGGYLNGNRLERCDQMISASDIDGMQLLLRAGKKRYHKIIVEN